LTVAGRSNKMTPGYLTDGSLDLASNPIIGKKGQSALMRVESSAAQARAQEPTDPAELANFDPTADGLRADPYGVLGFARRNSPVFHLPDHDMWCVTRYEDVAAILRDPGTYSNAPMGAVPEVPEGYREQLPNGYPGVIQFGALDPPAHTRIRRLAQQAMVPRILSHYEPAIRDIAAGMIDEFGDGEFDFVASFGERYAIRVMTSMLGVPLDDERRFQKWARDSVLVVFGPPPSAAPPSDEAESELRNQLTESMIEFDSYLRAQIAARRADPREDILTPLAAAIGDPAEGGFSEQEVMGILSQLLTGGTNTTSDLLAHSLVMLLEKPDRWRKLRQTPEDIALVLEETLRRCSPARAVYRRTTKPVTLGAAEIPAGALLWVGLGSANRDDTVFASPEHFDPHRENLRDHFGFGRWTHFCLGAPLGRLIGRIALEQMTDRLPTLRLVEAPREKDYSARILQPKLMRLRLSVT